ncbi:MAG: hypothetical protein P4L71_07205, partial [Acetobacteraceae bacterium]|nr:hypothetical protein [Acetobacteraceae bacterium]
MTIDLIGGWSAVTNTVASGFGTAGPATLPTTVASAAPVALDYVVRFITEQGTTLTLDGAQYFALDGFSFGATQTLSVGSSDLGAGKVSFGALNLSL